MKTDQIKDLQAKYKVIAESWAGVGGEAGGGDAASESDIDPTQPKTALDWKLAGLFEPETPETKTQTETALKEINELLNKFKKELEAWQKKHTKLGAGDTVSREQLSQYISKSVLGLTKLD